MALTGLAMALLVALLVGIVLGLKWVIQALGPVLWPLAVAGVLAYLLDPVVDFLERKRVPRNRSIILVFSLALMILAAIFASIVPQIIAESRDLISRIPAYVERVQHRAEQWITHPPPLLQNLLRGRDTPQAALPGTNEAPMAVITNTEGQVVIEPTNAPPATRTEEASAWLAGKIDADTLGTATGWITKYTPIVGSWLFGQVGRVASWFGMLAGLALIPVYAFYLLAEKKGIQSKWSDYLPVADSSFKKELVFVLGSINDYLIAFFRGQVLVAICDGILYTIGFMMINLRYAVLLGVVATFLTMIPFLGAIVTCAAALILAALQHGDWLHPMLVLVVFAVVQALEGFVISPKIMGDRVGLHPLTIIIAVMAGTTILGGILGGILAIPLTAVLRVVLARYIWKRAIADMASG
jgi:predicted PurR-regulated permease PerM